MIDWSKITEGERETISKIAKRARPLFLDAGVTLAPMDIIMDLEAAHLDTPLRLNELLEAPEPDFGHDTVGIYRHLNRQTGELENCFVPRCAR